MYVCVTVGGIKTKETTLRFYNTLFTLNPACGLLQTGHETARPCYGGITYILDNYRHNQLQVTNIVSFPLCLTSSRTYSINARSLSGYYPKSGYSRTIQPASEAGYSRTIRSPAEAWLLPDYPTDIRSRAIPGLSGEYPKSGFSRTIWQLSEGGLLPDYPTTIRSRATTHSWDCARPFYEGKNVYILKITNMREGKICSFLTQTSEINTYDTQCTRFISPLHNVGPSSMKSENKLTFPTRTLSGATVKARVTKDNARDPSRWHAIFPCF